MNRRTRRTLLAVAAVLLLLALAIFLRSKAPPEAARLLPEADGILYVNLQPMRAFLRRDRHGDLKPPTHDPEYQQFIDATGIDWEQDLDQVAVALHRMDDPRGPNGPVAYSMVLVGKLTGPKLKSWLESHAAAQEAYAGHTIYSIPSEGRTVRVTQIGYDMMAVSNYPTAEKIHSMIDRHRTAALPFANSTLLAAHYHDVPLLSLAWGVGEIGLPFNESGTIHVLGFELPLASDSTIVASVTPGLPPGLSISSGLLHLRVEEIAPTETVAARQYADLKQLVDVAGILTAPLGETPANRGLKELLKTAQVSQDRTRVVVKATLTQSALSAFAAEDAASPAQGSASK
ncbi:hypothetical protein [Terracidiphilus gabretensis]|jgi:hypothetical protein|uniref:hypothetical protein n=1 Tax=Terracidiphilus gabretensis TaxID=1577687 RepID=UPI0012FA7EAE|nr:hypothetical protein [Terracidiphilus gabretensis]